MAKAILTPAAEAA